MLNDTAQYLDDEGEPLVYKITRAPDPIGDKDHVVLSMGTGALLYRGTKRECFNYVRQAKGLGPMKESSR